MPVRVMGPLSVAVGASIVIGAGLALRQAEVEQYRRRRRQHDVAGLEIAMDDAGAMRGDERAGDLRTRRSAPGGEGAARA